MAAKAVLIVCVQALLLQSISGQCIGAGWASPCGGAWRGAGFCGAGLLAPAAASASHGGGLAIASASPISPNGVSVLSENSYCGELAVRGALPFLGTVGLEGELPTAGAAAVAYGCGNGQVGMVSEDIGAAGIGGFGYGGALGYGIGGLGCGTPLVGLGGCGCGRGAFI